MQNHGTPELNLTERLKEQVEEQVELSRKTMKDALQRLSAEWQISMQRELTIIASAMQEKGRELEKMQKDMLAELLYALKLPVAITIVLTMTFCTLWIYAAGYMTDTEGHERNRIRMEIRKLEKKKNELLSLPVSPWKYQGEDYLILPKGYQLQEMHISDGRPAYKLTR